MVFWIGILVGALFAWLAITIGFYETWAMLFNIVISIYVGIFLRPMVADIIPAAGNMPYSNALTTAALVIACFLILHGISYIFFTSQFSVVFPRVFNTLGSGFLGFLAGFLVWSLVSFLICIMPISQNTFVKGIGFDSQSQQTNISYLRWWCDLVNTMVSSGDSEVSSEQAISELVKSVEKKARARTVGRIKPAEPNKPAEPAGPNDIENSPIEKDRLGLLPNVDVEDIGVGQLLSRCLIEQKGNS